jgi:hypothetical protein
MQMFVHSVLPEIVHESLELHDNFPTLDCRHNIATHNAPSSMENALYNFLALYLEPAFKSSTLPLIQLPVSFFEIQKKTSTSKHYDLSSHHSTYDLGQFNDASKLFEALLEVANKYLGFAKSEYDFDDIISCSSCGKSTHRKVEAAAYHIGINGAPDDKTLADRIKLKFNTRISKTQVPECKCVEWSSTTTIKRFKADTPNTMFIHFEKERTALVKKITIPTVSSTAEYVLHSVIAHSPRNSHFVTYILQGASIILCNDEHISNVSEEQLLQCDPHWACYKRIQTTQCQSSLSQPSSSQNRPIEEPSLQSPLSQNRPIEEQPQTLTLSTFYKALSEQSEPIRTKQILSFLNPAASKYQTFR